MRNVLSVLTLVALIAVGTGVLTGCSGSGTDEMLQDDPELSKQKAEEYSKQMREAMQKQGRPVPPEGGTK